MIQALQLIITRDPALMQIVAVSLRVTGTALLFSTLVGIPLGSWLGLTRFLGRRLVIALLYMGMGAVLTMANEQLAYTLTDRGTYLARTLEGIDLPILVEGDPILFNPYGIIVVNTEVHPRVNFDLAMSFINCFTAVPTQKVIGEFGQPLFVPDSEDWQAAQ